MVENFDPKPLASDTEGMEQDEVQAMEDRMVAFLSAASDELNRREQNDQG